MLRHRFALGLAGFVLALVPGAVAAIEKHASDEALPFIADDYPRALAEARAKKLPIFVEAWTPW